MPGEADHDKAQHLHRVAHVHRHRVRGLVERPRAHRLAAVVRVGGYIIHQSHRDDAEEKDH